MAGRNQPANPVRLGPDYKRASVTYGRVDQVLRSLGFIRRLSKKEPTQRIYEEKSTGALIMFPELPDSEKMIDYHLVATRVILDNYGIMDPKTFDAELEKAG